MNELRFVGRVLSVAVGGSFYILVWALIFENWGEYAKSLYDRWCWEKILGIFYRIWVWGHIIAVVGGLIAWCIWSWI